MRNLNFLKINQLLIVLLVSGIFFSSKLLAQAPQKMNYQTIVYNSSNAVVSNLPVGLQISILQGSALGTAVYVETHLPTTSINGIANVEIGNGTVVSGSFASIDWANGPYFLKTEIDPSGGANYTNTISKQLLSVPYALFSGNGINGISPNGDTLLWGNGGQIPIPGVALANPIASAIPQKISYQSVVYNASNQVLSNQTVGTRFSILQGAVNGSAVYVETHTATTASNGVLNLEIGGGTPVSGTFSAINWANGPYFLKTETDPTGGNTYTLSDAKELLSVPYAFSAGNGITGVSATGDTLLLGNGNTINIPGISQANTPPFAFSYAPHTCGADSVHNGNLTYGTMTDQDGNVYKTIIIGTQEWMAENLKVSHYRNGDLIPVVNSSSSWIALTTGATCWYNFDSAVYHCPYGKFFNSAAANDSRNVCPVGWHLPSQLEVDTLLNSINPAFGGGYEDCFDGGELKSVGINWWNAPNFGATNLSGFSAIGAGANVISSQVNWGLGAGFTIITNTSNFGLNYGINVDSSSEFVGRGDIFPPNSPTSVRCLRD